MTDRVTDYAMKSTARHLETDVSMLDDAYVITPDFDWNRKPNPANLGNTKIVRGLPYAAVLMNLDATPPFTVGNILYEQTIDTHIFVVASGYTQMVQATADVKQSLKGASNSITGSIGIPLYNFAVASGGFFANAGTLQVEIGTTQYFAPEDTQQESNLKYRSVTPVTLSAYKDATATLLENKGRVNQTDT